MYHIASDALVQFVVYAVSVLLSCVLSIARGLKAALTLVAAEVLTGISAKTITFVLAIVLVSLIALALSHRVRMHVA